MIRGIDGFREWFKGLENQYVIIGGTACDLLMAQGGLDFRATKGNQGKTKESVLEQLFEIYG